MSRKPRDTADQTAFNFAAPADERYDANAELQKAHMPSLSDIRPQGDIAQVIDWIRSDLEEQAFAKALQSGNVVPFPSKRSKAGDKGMQSVFVDDLQISVMGDFIDKPGAFGFDSMRAMVDQTPVLNAVIMTRIRQVSRFCRVQESGSGPGFAIRHIDREHQITDDEKQSVQLLQKFFTHCGWEFSPRARKRLRRDNFQQFMAKAVRDSLTLDSVGIETEFKRDKRLGIDGFYAVDGATIRLCSEEGYKGKDEIFALQVVQGRITAAYNYDDLIYEPRNPRADVLAAGYGLSETELLIRVVTGYLNALTYNIKGFDSNSIPKGILHLTGNYSENDLAAFKRYWNAMVRGVNNAWTLPMLVSKDQESKAAFENFGIEFNEMYFAKWMTFLTSIICAIYGMSPSEINFDSFTGGNTSALSGSDTEEKLADSKDKGLRPLLSYFENIFTDFIVADFSDKYVFRWTGLDEDDAKQQYESRKLAQTWNEFRAVEGLDKVQGPLGDMPMNPSFVGPWLQMQQAQQPQDFGNPDATGGAGGDAGGGGPGDQGGGAPGDDQQQGDQQGDDQQPDFGQNPGESEPADFGKAFGLPVIFKVEP